VVWRRLRDSRLRRKDLSAKGLHVPPGDKLPASAVHYVQLLAALLVVGVGVVVAVNALQLLSGGLVPQLLLPGSGLAVGGLLLARSLARRGRAILGSLLVSLADALHELLDFAALSIAVMSSRVDRA